MRLGVHRFLPIGCCLSVALCLVLVVTGAAAQHSSDWPDIVFTKNLGAVYQLYGVMADGTELDQLYPWPDDVGYDSPVWSSDRRTIAYSREWGEAIYALDLVTGEERLLLAKPSGYWQMFPRQWSPDGQRFLLYGSTSYDGHGVTRIWVVDADGQNATCLSDPEAGYSDFQPHWMPDGQKIVFGSDRDDPFTGAGQNIWMMNPDGSGVTRITDSAEQHSRPYPSPDGKSIAFVIGSTPSYANIYIMDADGSNITQLTSATGVAAPIGDPWSPDGQRLLFRERGNIVPTYFQIYVINRDGSGQTCLSPAATEEVPRTWSPEGDRIAFESSDDNVWVMNADGSGRLNISQGVGGWPAWRAEGIRRIYLPHTPVTPDTDILVPVNMDTCAGVAGLQMEVTFDPDILECTDVVKGPLLPGSWAMPSPNIDNFAGSVQFIAYDAGAVPLPPGSGEAFTVDFHVKDTAPCCTASALHFAECLVSDEWGDPILMTAVDGQVTTPTEMCELSLSGTGGYVEVDGEPHSLPWSEEYQCNSELSLLAVPDPGYDFSTWSGDLVTTENPAALLLDSSKSVTAEFVSEPCSLTILGSNGHIAVDGFEYSLPWSGQYPCGTAVTVAALADACYEFYGWSGDIFSLMNPMVVDVNSNLILTANFELSRYVLSLSKTGSGSAAVDELIYALPATLEFYCGSELWLEALPRNEHWVFDYWSGDLGGSENPTSLLMDSSKSVTANFLGHTLSVSCSADPGVVCCGGNSQLEAQCADSLGHSMTMYWNDMLAFDPYVAGLFEGGAPRDVVVQGNYGYCAAQGVLTVYDISDPGNPSRVGVCDVPGFVDSIALSGDYVFVGAEDRGVHVINVADQSAPILVATVFSNLDRIRAVAVSVVIDVSNPATPVHVGTCETPEWVTRIDVSGGCAHVADSNFGLRLIDVSSPSAPVQVGFTAAPEGPFGVAVAGGYAYVAGVGEFCVVDVTSPASPTEVGSDRTWGAVSDVAISGRYAYVAAVEAGLRVIDLEHPGGPTEIGSCPTEGYCVRYVAVSGDYVFGGCSGSELSRMVVFDVSDAAHPVEVSSWEPSNEYWGCPPPIAITGCYALIPLGCCDGYLYVVDISDPTHPVEVGYCDIAGYWESQVAASGMFAYLTEWLAPGMKVVDLSDPSNPEVIAYFPVPGGEYTARVSVAGDHAYLMSSPADGDPYGRNLYIADITNPALPVLISTVDLPESVHDVAVSGNRAYLATDMGGNGRLTVMDITSPETPVLVGAYEGQGSGAYWFPPSVAASPEYTCFGDSGWAVTAFSNADVPEGPLGSFAPSELVPDPVYTAPENHGDQDLVVLLQAVVTCDGDPSLTETGTCSLTVTPAAVIQALSSSGAAGDTARVPIMLDLHSLWADRFAFSVQVTPIGAAQAITSDLGFDVAPGLDPPGLVSPSGDTIAVAWLSPLAESVTGSIYLGDILVPVPGGAVLGDAYEVCMLSVGASLGPDEICSEAGECATLTVCGLLLVGDAYPPKDDLNEDGDTCDFMEFGDADELGTDGLTWGDVITVFDAWAIPGSFPCPEGTWRVYAMDSYPVDTEEAPGGNGAITWGDIITTFDRWANPGLERPWRLVCDPETVPAPQAAAKAASALSRGRDAAPVLRIADASGAAGATVQARVSLELTTGQADRVAFAVALIPTSPDQPAAVITSFKAASGLPEPMVVSTPEGGIAVAWLVPVSSALSGAASLGDLLVALPSDAAEGDAWRLHLTAAGASLGPNELAPPATPGSDATVSAEAGQTHDVKVRRFRAPRRVRIGDRRRLSIEVQNLTDVSEDVQVRLLRNGETIETWQLGLEGRERRRVSAEYRFVHADSPSVAFSAEAVVDGDANPEDNTARRTVVVR